MVGFFFILNGLKHKSLEFDFIQADCLLNKTKLVLFGGI